MPGRHLRLSSKRMDNNTFDTSPRKAMSSGVDRLTLERQIVSTEGQVARLQHLVALQQRLIADLQRDGHRTSEAQVILTACLDKQRQHLENCERLRGELARLAK
jgi:hypothetical protein